MLSLHALTASAAPSSRGSWTNQPSWADEPSTSSQPKRYSSYEDSRNTRRSQIAPFAPGSHNVALDVGQVFLMGDIGEKYTDNIGLQGHYTYGASELFGFDASLGYSSHTNGQFSVLSLLTGLRVNLAWYDKVVPYISGGLGFYRTSQKFGAGPDAESLSPVQFGLHIGPGVTLQLTNQFFFGSSITFHDIFNTTEALRDGTQVEMGGTYTSFLLHAGVTF